jgi:hypothetical protein
LRERAGTFASSASQFCVLNNKTNNKLIIVTTLFKKQQEQQGVSFSLLLLSFLVLSIST